MNEEKKTIRSWLETAVSGIRFRPDREEAERELRDHLEDKVADLRRIYPDMDEKEAETMAVERMGDAEEIGKELAKLHKPWIGYLWRASRALACVMLCLAVFGMWRHENLQRDLWDILEWAEQNRAGRADSQELYEDARSDWEAERVGLYAPQIEDRMGRCVISVDRAALWRTEEGYSLFLETRLDFDLPWRAERAPFLYLWAEDSLGNRYDDYEGKNGAGYSTRGMQSGFGWRSCNWDLVDFPPEAEWVRIHYLPGTDLDLLIDLREVAE